jgi:general secretion pathway protein E
MFKMLQTAGRTFLNARSDFVKKESSGGASHSLHSSPVVLDVGLAMDAPVKPASSASTPSTATTLASATPLTLAPHTTTAASVTRQDHGARAAPLEVLGQMRFSAKPIDAQDDLANIHFEGCLNNELSLAEHLSLQCAVLCTDRKAKQCVVLLGQAAGNALVDALLLQLKQRGWSLPGEGAQAWRITSPSLLLALVRGHVNVNQLDALRRNTKNPQTGALWTGFKNIIWWAYCNKANDVDFILHTGDMIAGKNAVSRVAFKIDGVYTKPDRWEMPTETLVQMLGAAWQLSNGGHGSKFQTNEFQQAALKVDGFPDDVRLNLRWSGMPTVHGTTVTMRIQRLGESLPIKSLQEAGYLPWQMAELTRALRSKGGLMTFAGTVGSGKTISLALLMNMLPPDVKIISMEDPVEVEMPQVHQTSISRDLAGGKESSAMRTGVSAALRSAFDHMIWGEVRDKETGLVVRSVIDSGHSAYTTTHAASALMVLDKYMSPIVEIPRDVLGTPGNIKLNVYQALMPTLCSCALDNEGFEASLSAQALAEHQAYMAEFNALYKPKSEGRYLRWLNPQGCEQCCNVDLPQLKGVRGRTVVAEMLAPDEHLCELILKGDKVAMHRYWRSSSDGDIESGNLAGKTALECAVHKALTLRNIDLRTIERQFESFASLSIKAAANAAAVTKPARNTMPGLPAGLHSIARPPVLTQRPGRTQVAVREALAYKANKPAQTEEATT